MSLIQVLFGVWAVSFIVALWIFEPGRIYDYIPEKGKRIQQFKAAVISTSPAPLFIAIVWLTGG